jgi:hypothetical protein
LGGVCYDGHIWRRTGGQQLLDWEWWIGDGAYIAEPQVLSPCRKPPNGDFSEGALNINRIISHYRARVEHTNHLFESHAILQGAFRGGYDLLSDSYHVLANTINIHLRTHIRYPTYGEWAHY